MKPLNAFTSFMVKWRGVKFQQSKDVARHAKSEKRKNAE